MVKKIEVVRNKKREQYIFKLKKKVMKMFDVDLCRANELIDKVCEYDLNSEIDMFYIIQNQLLEKQERINFFDLEKERMKKGAGEL